MQRLRNIGYIVWIWTAVALIVSGCSTFRPVERPSPAEALPQTFSVYSSDQPPPYKWWRTFESPTLDRLIEAALNDNFSLHKAWARLRQAGARAVQAGADRYASLTAGADTDFGKQRISNGVTSTNTIRDLSMGLVGSYELDLWGRIRSEHQAALLEVSASREDLNTAAISVAAEVATRWVNIISQGLQKRLLEKQLQINQTYLELVELRFRKAMVSALDIYQQRQVVENIRAQIPLVEKRRQLLLNELAVLTGKPSMTDLEIQDDDLPSPPPIPSTGLPAQLLTRRPDVVAAGLRLQATDWQIAAARANRLPAVSLSATARYGPAEIDDLFDNWLLNLAGNLTAPILDGGRREAEVDRTQAVAQENLSAYREAVYTAFREVEDALISEVKQHEHVQALQREIQASQSALIEARERYRKGLNDYLPVLTQLLVVQSRERDLIVQQTELLLARIDLHRALGGTWTDTLDYSPQPPIGNSTDMGDSAS